MRQLLCVILALTMAPLCFGQRAKVVPQEVLDRIVDEDPNPLPRYMTPAERLAPLPTPDSLRLTPPTGLVATPSEYDHNRGLLVRWGSFNSEITAMTVPITTADPDAIVYILVWSTSLQASATATLTSAGADMDQVEFIVYDSDSVWIRDYGPRFILEDAEEAIVDHTYNRVRPNDNLFPDHLAGLWGLPEYDIPLTHGGGNFHLFSTGDAFMSDLILSENTLLTAQEVKDYYRDYLNVDLTIFPGFPFSFDGTKHIDMWMLPVQDDTVIIGQYSSSTGQPYTITENAVTELASRGYTIYRTPGWQSDGIHYTYTNSVIFNDLVFLAQYGGSFLGQDAAALAMFEMAFPHHQIIPVNCSGIIGYSGAIHCIVMHVPGENILDCNENGIPDEEDILTGTSSDANGNGIPDECEVDTPLLAPAPHDARKNRYISIVPNNRETVAIEVTLASMMRCSGDDGRTCSSDDDCVDPPAGTCAEHPQVNSHLGWMSEPDVNDCATVVSTPVYRAWPEEYVHISACQIIPVATYEIRATPDTVVYSDSLLIGTITKPGPHHFGDTAGVGTGDLPPLPGFTPPNGIANVNDITAYLLTAYGPSTPSADRTWVDLHGLGDGCPPNYILNVSDLQRIQFGIKGLR
ncbi:MAG: agmatine deiminase family protein, partial [Phycisphaerales bacterium]